MYVWSELAHTENAPFAVSPDGAVFLLPQEFDALTRGAEVVVPDADDARALLDFFLGFYVAVPGTDELVVLDDVRDIVGVAEADVDQHDDAVRPAAVERVEGGWSFELHT